MAPIKIYPPTKLPEKGVTDLLFNIWVEEIEVYLSQDDRFTPFMRGGPYSTWLAYDANADRIAGPQGEDAAADLPTRRAQLRTFLSIVAKACNINHYNVVTRHSTSLQWIYDKLREDYDIQQKGIHFFNLLDLQYKAGSSVMGFYNEYRNVIIANLKKRGDEIRWLNETLNRDEKLSPTFEDLILINVLGIIDARLPLHVRDHYHHHIGRDKTLMDYKSDILVKVPVFLSELDNKAQNNAMRANTEEHLGAMRFAPPARGRQTYYRGRSTPRGRGAYRGHPWADSAPSHLPTVESATSPDSLITWSDPTELATCHAPSCQQLTRSTSPCRGIIPASTPSRQTRTPLTSPTSMATLTRMLPWTTRTANRSVKPDQCPLIPVHYHQLPVKHNTILLFIPGIPVRSHQLNVTLSSPSPARS